MATRRHILLCPYAAPAEAAYFTAAALADLRPPRPLPAWARRGTRSLRVVEGAQRLELLPQARPGLWARAVVAPGPLLRAACAGDVDVARAAAPVLARLDRVEGATAAALSRLRPAPEGPRRWVVAKALPALGRSMRRADAATVARLVGGCALEVVVHPPSAPHRMFLAWQAPATLARAVTSTRTLASEQGGQVACFFDAGPVAGLAGEEDAVVAALQQMPDPQAPAEQLAVQVTPLLAAFQQAVAP